MISQTRIETMDQLMQLMAEQQYRPELKRYRDLQIYRGECNASFTLSTSLQRNCKGLSRKLEQPMLHNFTKYAVLEVRGLRGADDRGKCMEADDRRSAPRISDKAPGLVFLAADGASFRGNRVGPGPDGSP